MLPGRLRRIMSLSCLQPFLECPLRSPLPRTWVGGLTRTRTDPGFASRSLQRQAPHPVSLAVCCKTVERRL